MGFRSGLLCYGVSEALLLTVTSKSDRVSDGSETTNGESPMADFSPVVVVPDVTALSLLIASGYPDGTQAFVLAENALYTLNIDANVTADGTYVVSPATGAPIAGLSQARWVVTSTDLNLNKVISPTALAADADDYAPTGFQGASILRCSATTTGIQITGFAAPTSGLSRQFMITNIGTTAANTIQLDHQSGSSVAANRMILPADAALVIPIGGAVTLFYDVTSTRWRVLSIGYFTDT